MTEVEEKPVIDEPKPEPTKLIEPEPEIESVPEPTPNPITEPEPEPEPEPIPEPVKVRRVKPMEFIQISGQQWSNRNLMLEDIPSSDFLWAALTDKDWLEAQSAKRPAFCYPNEDKELAEEQGYLFNWYAVKALTSNLPEGWVVPNLKDLALLQANLSKNKTIFFKEDFAQQNDIHIEHRLPMATFADATTNRCYWSCDEGFFFTAYAYQIPLEKEGFELRKIDKNAGYFIRVMKR